MKQTVVGDVMQLSSDSAKPSIFVAFKGRWHSRVTQIFIALFLVHWCEHVWQAIQVYVLQWPPVHSHGAIGLLVPWLNTSEWLHYSYNLIILAGLVLLRSGFEGSAKFWWSVALALQTWHFFEHALLLTQVLLHKHLFGLPIPTSILQLVVPRIELHLFYNTVVTIPVAMALKYYFCDAKVQNQVRAMALTAMKPE